ncbi:SDR family NAD(P)-dependent oxidoreductase [Streptacidiphilus sp. ASG 303]|uniref:SDR family oxidoreductase n=1 Tax=Streptacidiphilus sp. ASG 303 TaxID=2896847 RepID=UPI001E346FB4|nr:SDR family oxidoreductase [Streptacidiphilus sp. ASG 303]MCD0485433.1 SDR family NAD(P)-dependent oxidoreductase [Streptacidiphilus sp. ASG 303]
MTQLCSGRVALVTGAGRGIGREHALSLARHGAAVVVNDRGGAVSGDGADTGAAQQVVDEITALGGRAVADHGDVSDWDQAREMVHRAVEHFGDLHVVVNNAGILRDRMLVNMSPEEWDAVVAVHLRGTFNVTRHAAQYWRDRSKAGRPADARIINTTSPSGLYGNVGQANYGAAKAGIAAFTTIVAEELHRYGVTANAVAPAALTRMTEHLIEVDAATAELLAPRWIAPVVTWLASAESRHVTGRVFDVSGQALAVSEGWHRGPTAEPVADPALLGATVAALMAEARPNADMTGADKEGPGRPVRVPAAG